MNNTFRELHTLHMLSGKQNYGKNFTVPKDLRVLATIVILTILAAIAGSILFKIDKIVPAQGVLETQTKLFNVSSLYPAMLTEIHIKEGMVVKVGTLLISLDDRTISSEIDQINSELKIHARSIWSDFFQVSEHIDEITRDHYIEKIKPIKDMISPSGLRPYLTKQLNDSLQSVDSARASLKAQLGLQRDKKKFYEEELAYENNNVLRLVHLHALGIESSERVTLARRSEMAIENQLNTVLAEMEIISAEDQKSVLELSRLKNDYIVERLGRIQNSLDAIDQLNSRNAIKLQQKEDYQVRAPANAIVDTIVARGPNEVIERNETLVTLRPEFSSADLEVVVFIPSQFAIWVTQGMTFRASSLGNNPEDHGRLTGIITFISKSSEMIEGKRQYRMKGQITKMDLSSPDTFLRPGQQLSVEIKAGERRLINYIIDPFINKFSKALSEPS